MTLGSDDHSRLDAAIRAARDEALRPDVRRGGAAPQVGEYPGLAIERYELVQEIGEGGFGVVWRAMQTFPVRRAVALKILKPGLDTRQVVARFEAERQALALMNHPNIAKVLDAGSTPAGRPYFAMELVDGVPITEYCDGVRLDVPGRLRLFVEVCRAIQHAHQKGVVHRDIKPTNVLVAAPQEGGAPIPKVIDFGIAKAISADLSVGTFLTEARQVIGTPEYMAPEQADPGVADVDTRADVYGLGVLLYELLTGAQPFDFGRALEVGYEELLRAIREEEPRRPSTRLFVGEREFADAAAARQVRPRQLGQMLRGDLDWIVLKALEKERSRRYATVSGLAEDVERHLEHEPVLASPPGRWYRLRKLIRRQRVAFAFGAGFSLLLAAGAAGTAWGWMRAERELARAGEIKSLMSDMLSSVDPERARSADVTVLKDILDRTARRLAAGEVEDELVAAELHHVVGLTYVSLGLYEEAARHQPTAFEIRSRRLGDDAPETLLAARCTAALWSHLGRYEDAERLFEDVLEAQRRRAGDRAAVTLRSMKDLALIYRRRGRYEEAEGLLRAVMASDSGDPEGAIARADGMRILATLHHSQGALRRGRAPVRRGLGRAQSASR